jgi:hypothetical protein
MVGLVLLLRGREKPYHIYRPHDSQAALCEHTAPYFNRVVAVRTA